MSCLCGPQYITEIPAGGLLAGGSAIVTTNFENATGGALTGGSAILTTNLLWDEFNAVFHLDETADGAVDEYQNSVGARHGRGDKGQNILYVPDVTPGVWYNAQEFDGNAYISLTKDAIGQTNPITVSLWAKITGEWLHRVWYSRGFTDREDGEGWSIWLGHTPDNTLTGKVQVVGSSNWVRYEASGSTVLTADCWYHVALVWQPSSGVTLYLDGEQEATRAVTETTLVPHSGNSHIGRVDSAFYTIGQLQELRVSPVVRSADWIGAEFDNLCSNEFYTIGQIEGASYG